MSGTVGSRNGPNSAKSSPAKPTTPKKNKVKAPGSKRKRASEDEYVRNLSTIPSTNDGQSVTNLTS